MCGQVTELPDQLPMTENTQLIASVLLNKIYDDLKCDPERDNFRDICDQYIKYVYRFPIHQCCGQDIINEDQVNILSLFLFPSSSLLFLQIQNRPQ